MEFKGTKGRWYFDKENAKVRKEDGNTLCIIYHTNINNKAESEPNALLISKAPEMLEAIKTTIEELAEINALSNLREYLKQLIKEATELN
jgi:hypothetical protein